MAKAKTSRKRQDLKVLDRRLFGSERCHVGGCDRDGTILISHGWVQWPPKYDANGLLYYDRIEGRTAWWYCDVAIERLRQKTLF